MMDRAELPVHRKSTLYVGVVIMPRFRGVTASRRTAWGDWLGCPDECAYKLALYLRGDLVHRDTGFGEKHAGIFDVIGARWLKVYVDKTGGNQLRSYSDSSNAPAMQPTQSNML